MEQRKRCIQKWIEDEKIGWFVINALYECLSSYQRPNVIFPAVSVTQAEVLLFQFSHFYFLKRIFATTKKNRHTTLDRCVCVHCWMLTPRHCRFSNTSIVQLKTKVPLYGKKHVVRLSSRQTQTPYIYIYICGRDREKRRWMKMCWPIGMSLSVQQSFHSWKRLSAQHITDFLFLDRNLFLFYVRSHSLLHEKNSVRRKMFPSSFDSVVA